MKRDRMREALALAVMAGLIGCTGERTPPRVVVTGGGSVPATQAAEHVAPPLVLGRNTVVTADVAYVAGTPDSMQHLNVYAPRGARGLPVVVFVHGGGWTRGDRAEVGSQPRLFNDAGVVLVSVDYRLSPGVRHPAHVEDVAAAVAWTLENIGQYGGDARNVFVMGHSAGSHLAALVATDPRPLAKFGRKPGEIRGVITLDGSAFDIPDRVAKGTEKIAENCRRAFGTDPGAQADASPINHVGAGGAVPPPFMVVYLTEGSLNHAQSRAFAEKVKSVGGRSSLRRVEGKTHASLVEDLGTDRQDDAGEAVVQFIGDVARRPAS